VSGETTEIPGRRDGGDRLHHAGDLEERVVRHFIRGRREEAGHQLGRSAVKEEKVFCDVVVEALERADREHRNGEYREHEHPPRDRISRRSQEPPPSSEDHEDRRDREQEDVETPRCGVYVRAVDVMNAGEDQGGDGAHGDAPHEAISRR
jgi:hypothetical protein